MEELVDKSYQSLTYKRILFAAILGFWCTRVYTSIIELARMPEGIQFMSFLHYLHSRGCSVNSAKAELKHSLLVTCFQQ